MTGDTSRGYHLASISILLATSAQLTMKWGMSHLPAVSVQWLTFAFLFMYKTPLMWVSIGILAYVLSMLSWLGTLSQIPLNKAYPLLSISYALVYIATISLPWFNEPHSILGFLGVACISLGVWLVAGSKYN